MRIARETTVRGDVAPRFRKCLRKAKEMAGPHQYQPIVQLLVEDALESRASDIHIQPQGGDFRVRFRVDGVVWDVARPDKEFGKAIINQFKAVAGVDPVIQFTPRDAHAHFNISGQSTDVRFAFTPCQAGEALTMRILDPRRLEKKIDDLGLTERNLNRLEQWLENVKGMFLAAGPTGAGKTTTIYSLLHELKYHDRMIITLEDPVEYEIDGITQVHLDEKHHLNFAEGVKSMLRLDPDYIMLGEIRDAPSAHAAINAAISGRVLLTTIHSRDAVGALTTLRNWGLADHEIAESLSVVVAQRLVRTLCRNCRRQQKPDSVDAAWLKSRGRSIPKLTWTATGCPDCGQLGYAGRTGVFEFWQLNGGDYESILSHASEHSIRERLAKTERISLIEDGLAKARMGTTSLMEIRRMAGQAHSSDQERL
jgi:general secretion pathway protein E